MSCTLRIDWREQLDPLNWDFGGELHEYLDPYKKTVYLLRCYPEGMRKTVAPAGYVPPKGYILVEAPAQYAD